MNDLTNYTTTEQPPTQCKKTDHVCTKCDQNVGTVAPMSDLCVKSMG